MNANRIERTKDDLSQKEDSALENADIAKANGEEYHNPKVKVYATASGGI